MKKALMTVAIMLMFLVVFLTPGCIKQITPETTEAKSYTIKVYSCEPKVLAGINKLAERENMTTLQAIKLVVENPNRNEFIKNVYNALSIDIYYAKEVKDFSETTVRFIDNTGKEKFISADYIKVEQR